MTYTVYIRNGDNTPLVKELFAKSWMQFRSEVPYKNVYGATKKDAPYLYGLRYNCKVVMDERDIWKELIFNNEEDYLLWCMKIW